MTHLEKIEALSPEIIDNFIRTGSSTAIPLDLQNIIKQMMWAAEIYETERNISRAAKKLQVRTKASSGIDIEISTAKSRIYAALNYFNVDCNVKEAVWYHDAANKFENLAKLAVASGRLDVVERSYVRSTEYRLKAVAADREATLGVVYIMSNDISPEDLGFTSRNKKEIARKASDGYYTQLIDSLNISNEEKQRLRADAEIEEAIIIENDEQ